MNRSSLIAALEGYRTSSLISEKELPMLEDFKIFLASNPNCFDRANKGHVTGSAWITNHSGTHALLTHHKKLNIWVQLGGHADGNPNIQEVAVKEAFEESGIANLELIYSEIFDIDIHAIPSQCEYHYDVRYLLKAPRGSDFKVSDESHDLAWVQLSDLHNYSKEPSVLRMARKSVHFLP
jgi:8-oxo-dGTP pyrophosphatase MutT (NUDIX family)